MLFARWTQRWQALPGRRRLLAALAGSLAWAAACEGLFFAARHQRLAQLQARALELRAACQEKVATALALPQPPAPVAELERRLEAQRAWLPQAAEMPQLLAALGKAAHEVGLELHRLRLRDEAPQEFFAELGFHLEASGTYHQVALYIDRLAHLERIVRVDNLSLKNPRHEEDKTVLQAALDIAAYRARQSTAGT